MFSRRQISLSAQPHTLHHRVEFPLPENPWQKHPCRKDLASKPRETTTEFVFPADGAKVPRAKFPSSCTASSLGPGP